MPALRGGGKGGGLEAVVDNEVEGDGCVCWEYSSEIDVDRLSRSLKISIYLVRDVERPVGPAGCVLRLFDQSDELESIQSQFCL